MMPAPRTRPATRVDVVEAAVPATSVRFDALVAGLSALWVGGLYLDGWAHNHLLSTQETFFTPWHAALYGAFALVAAAVGFATWRNRRALATSWRRSIPRGYGASALGVALFAAGGVADMAWHTIVGIEVSVEALFSPPHLFLAVSSVLVASGPLQATLARRGSMQAGSSPPWPALVALGLVWAVIGFFTQVLHPFTRAWAGAGNRPVDAVFALAASDPPLPATPEGVASADLSAMMGMAGVIVQTTVLVAVLAFAITRIGVPRGATVLLLGLGLVPVALMRDQAGLAPAVLVGALVGELAAARMRARPGDVSGARGFVVVTALALFAAYVAAVEVRSGVWWSVPLWSGAVVVAGLVAAGLSLALVPRPSWPGGAPVTSSS